MASTELDITVTFNEGANVKTESERFDKLFEENGIVVDKDDNLDPNTMQNEVKRLLADNEIEKKSGIYEYLLTGNEKYLHFRAFADSDIQTMYTRQNGLCAICGKPFQLKEMHADHKIPWSKGGKTTLDNLQMLCVPCNLAKSSH